jgi:tRNA threonylcarbamoyladenosine biosynthesis protein TsaB
MSAGVLLVIDTSLQGVSLALVQVPWQASSAPLLWETSHLEVMGSAQAISDLVAKGIAATGLTAASIRGIAVGHGPGTFTGIRIGLAFAAGFAAGLAPAAPIRGVSALGAALTWRCKGGAPGSPAVLLLPATKTHGYAARLTLTPAPAVAEASVDFAEAAPSPLLAESPRVFSFGEWPAAASRLAAAGATVLPLAPSEVCRDAIYGMALDAAHAWPGGFSKTAPEPRYLRLSTAEERLLAAGK